MGLGAGAVTASPQSPPHPSGSGRQLDGQIPASVTCPGQIGALDSPRPLGTGIEVRYPQRLYTRPFGDGALDRLEQTDRTVKARGRFFALVAHRFPGIGAASARWDDYRARMPQLVSAFPGVLEVLSRPRERRWRVAGLADQLRNAGPGRGGKHRPLRRGAEQLSASRGCGGCGGRPARPQDSPAKGKSDPIDAYAAARAALSG